MPYVVQSWVAGNGGGTPLGATRMNHIEAGLGEHESRIAAMEVDSGWLTATIAATFAGNNAGPQYRKIGKRVQCRYGWSSTGITTLGTTYTVGAAGAIPTGYLPPPGFFGWAGTNGVANTCRVAIGADGSIQLTPGGTAVSTYFRWDAFSWLID